MGLFNNIGQGPRNKRAPQAPIGNTGTPRTISSRDTKANFSAAVQQEAEKIAKRLLEEQLNQIRGVNSGRVYTRFDTVNDIVANQKEVVTKGLWTGGIGELLSYHTSSTQTSTQKQYYLEVWNSESIDCGAEPQFSIAWGHKYGSGSLFTGNDADSPSRAIYSQYRLLLLEPNDTTFTFYANGSADESWGNEPDHIYLINFNRARIKERLDPGNWQLGLNGLNSNYPNNEYTGSKIQAYSTQHFTLIDDSGDTNEEKRGNAGRIHNIVSGSIAGGIYKGTDGKPVHYGLSYPDMGILVLNGEALNDAQAPFSWPRFNTVTGSNIDGDNARKLLVSMQGSAQYKNVGFAARNSENVSSTYYFCRVKNAEYNFSNNPTWVTGSLGELAEPTFVGDPKTYVTTIGLYNDRQELVAVAKLSKPILKSFTNELVLRVKLDF